MDQNLPYRLEDVERSFNEAERNLGRGTFPEFIDAMIRGREQLKRTPFSDHAALALAGVFATRWRRLNETFESVFEWSRGIDLLLPTRGQGAWLDTSAPNFLGVKADLQALQRTGGHAAQELVVAGAGAFPQTLLYLHENTPIHRLVGIDRDPERAYLAKRLIRQCGVEQRIQLVVNDAAFFKYGSADVVIIASLVIGKHEVLGQVAATARPGTLVFLRVPFGWGHLFYEEMHVDGPDRTRFTWLESWKPAADALFQTHAFRLNATQAYSEVNHTNEPQSISSSHTSRD
jgi:hypothetical protein